MNTSMPSRRSVVPLVVAFTPSYFIPAVTCLWSVLQSSAPEACYEVLCMLTEPLSEDYQARLRSLTGDSGRMTFCFVELGEDALEGIYIDPKYTIAASFRLLLGELLPEWDKIIYLDCDMIVRNDLSELYRAVQMQGYYLAGVVEATTPWQMETVTRVGSAAGEYINSGFLVMNLDEIRRDGITQRFLEALRVDYLEFPDQDVLNQVCRGRILHLPAYYNAIRTFYLEGSRGVFLQYYTEQDWQAIQSHGTIHYTGEKPWRAYTPNFEYWWRCYLSLPRVVREGIAVNTRVLWLYRLLSLPLARPVFDWLNKLRRKL